MLARTRQERILRQIEENGSVTVAGLTTEFGASESTIRRDLSEMAGAGLLVKVFGGAVLPGPGTGTLTTAAGREPDQIGEKRSIGAYAASLISAGDFVFLGAGTTTGAMIPYITETAAVYVTDGLQHAMQLSKKGCRVYLAGGELRPQGEIVTGSEAFDNLSKYHFTKAFLGTGAVDLQAGLTTPDLNEAKIKQCAARRAKQTYILAVSSKFGRVCPVQFLEYGDAAVITDHEPDQVYRERGTVYVTMN
ncbi:MAG: DeoR/GlpR family DNA-binding transcription regulator [Lachnospiraceae bacterium]|nr:DeoR/GlpR family DNA-binding transcription regulator [Lachnospiraceae bacterium]